jgi:geranylgeranyl diphosphate synthase type II
MNLSEYVAGQRERIEAELDRLAPAETTPPETLHRAMRYSLFAGGKRLRPILCLEAGRAAADYAPGIERTACSLELVHTYSLIHDDLPALDNDDFRRGRPTCHREFGEAVAILAGDALLTLAFQALAELEGVPDTGKALLVAELARAAGTVGGMIGGQMADLEGVNATPTADLLERIHRAKTGALLTASLRMGAICAGASPGQLEALTRYGRHVGLAFQIVDDILDVEEPSQALGKTAGKDAQQGKITFPAVYGLAESHRMAEEEAARACAAVESFGERAERLSELAEYIVRRKK